MRILVDADDTIEHLSDAWIKYLNKKYKTKVKRENVDDWNISKFFPEIPVDEVYAPLDEPEFWKTVTPFEDAAEVLQKLIDDGHEIYIVTSSSRSSIKPKFDYVIAKYFPFIEWNEIIVTYNKKIINADVMIDDGVHNLIGADCVRILMDAPYNRDFNEEAYGMFRVRNWKEIYDLINSGKLEACDIHGVGVYKGKKKIRNDLFGEINE